MCLLLQYIFSTYIASWVPILCVVILTYLLVILVILKVINHNNMYIDACFFLKFHIPKTTKIITKVLKDFETQHRVFIWSIDIQNYCFNRIVKSLAQVYK